MPKEDLDLIHCDGPEMESILKKSDVRLTQFTGSSRVGERLAKALHGKVRLEDAGFDWKILGPDVDEVDYVAWQCDQDAYAFSGQKCSAQSIMFMHTNWHKHDFLPKLKEQASKRSLLDMSIGPVLTWNNTQIKEHID
jgi:1-pyrroline-5-carboxylate dehydrogenase